jgi:hypothetical protein
MVHLGNLGLQVVEMAAVSPVDPLYQGHCGQFGQDVRGEA